VNNKFDDLAMLKGSEWLTSAMELQGVSQCELARRTNSSRSWVTRVVNGKCAMKLSSLLALLDAAGLEVVELRVRPKEVDKQ